MNKSQTKSLSEARIKKFEKYSKTLTEEKIENLIYNCTLGVENSFRMFEYNRNLKQQK